MSGPVQSSGDTASIQSAQPAPSVHPSGADGPLVMLAPVVIGELSEQPTSVVGKVEAAGLDLQAQSIVTAEPLAYDLTAYLAGSEALVRGKLLMTCVLECVRCLQVFDSEQRVADFIRSFPFEEAPHTLDLAEHLREDILLTFPTFPQCSADCKGLCALCGNNLNKQSCDCRREIVDPRWEGLDQLSLGDLSPERT